MIQIALSFLTTLLLVGPSVQLQNICASNKSIIAFQDPSDCHLLLYCHYDKNKNFINYTIESCYENFFEYDYFSEGIETGWFCQKERPSSCNDPILLCPPASEPDILIADPDDKECRRYRYCRQVGTPYHSCPPPLVFNRNTGLCDHEKNAPCAKYALPPKCEKGATGNFPSDTCNRFIQCKNGIKVNDFVCAYGLYFDTVTKKCIDDVTGKCYGGKMIDESIEGDVIKVNGKGHVSVGSGSDEL